MFFDNEGNLRVDTEKLAAQIRQLPPNEAEKLSHSQAVLRNALMCFDERLAGLPAEQRKAALTLFYARIIDTLFDFHLSIETSMAREQIVRVGTRSEKADIMAEFEKAVTQLHQVYRLD